MCCVTDVRARLWTVTNHRQVPIMYISNMAATEVDAGEFSQHRYSTVVACVTAALLAKQVLFLAVSLRVHLCVRWSAQKLKKLLIVNLCNLVRICVRVNP